MNRLVVGTAGHIDHGKSTLVHALTGIDPDRLKEEKARGITIELGFAHATVGDARIAFVDVPGHERFVRTMLAGVGGVDFVMLVVAADESVMPQTREHFDICRLLGITDGCVVVTKADAADADTRALVALEAGDLVRGSFLEGKPLVVVSARACTTYVPPNRVGREDRLPRGIRDAGFPKPPRQPVLLAQPPSPVGEIVAVPASEVRAARRQV